MDASLSHAAATQELPEIDRAIRKAIALCGGRASSERIKWQLRRMGWRVNQHDVLKRLSRPRFILSSGGWMNELRQLDMFEDAM